MQSNAMKEDGAAYPRQRIFGVFLVVTAAGLYAAVAFPYQGAPNGALFGVFYGVSLFGVMLNPFARKKFSAGTATARQRLASNLSLAFLALGVVLIFTLASGLRTVWLSLLMVVGLHFFGFVPVHGKLVGILGLLLCVNAVAGLGIGSLSLTTLFIVDATLKLAAGAVYLKFGPFDW